MKHTDHVTIFIADEDELVNMALRHEIEKAFATHVITILTFSSVSECGLFMKQRPEIVIMDSRLNDSSRDKNGVTLIDKIKADNPRTQVIMLSVEESIEVAVKALHHGAHDYIVKNEFMFKKLRLSLIQCFTILELRRNMKKQVGLGILTIIIVFLMFGVAVGMRAYAPATF
jgi:DNA-binding NarL/FixJ family response regulator